MSACAGDVLEHGEDTLTTSTYSVLTTGEVAKICHVAARTVSKWFDSGVLPGYRIPGSKERRIPMSELVRFMKQHGMPLNGLITGIHRVMIVDDEQDVLEVLQKILEEDGKYDVEFARGGFAAGIAIAKHRPHVILLDMHLRDVDAAEFARQVKDNPDLQPAKVIAMSDRLSETELRALTHHGFDGYLKKPFHMRQVTNAIADAMSVLY